jgi:hypothetical protein
MKAKRLISMIVVVTLCLGVATQQAQAQQPGSDSSKKDSSADAVTKINLSNLPGRAWRSGQPGLLMASSRYSSVSNFDTTAAVVTASSPAVHGSGTVGKISLWVDTRPNGESTLGDSIITQLNGHIGIGLATPASKLTVQGMIETTLGGYKFPDGTVQTTAALSGLQSVFHDQTLQGDGTQGRPVGVAVPLNVTGAVLADLSDSAVIKATNTAEQGTGVTATGGDSGSGSAFGGDGVSARGGAGNLGGFGVSARGGAGNTAGGVGVSARGGAGRTGGGGGDGVEAFGGASNGGGSGGDGVSAIGGFGNGAGNRGGIGVVAQAGVGQGGAIDGLAGLFVGDVVIGGNLSVAGTKNFKIDHPLDPENRYLLHAAIESSEVLNIYSGNIVTNAKGEAVVTLPEWFETLNRDLRYQLTVIGTFAQAIVTEKVNHNRFTIRTNAPNVEVSWQVTGVRSDAVMLKHPFKAEEDKPERERGTYLNPDAYGQPEERAAAWVRHPEMMEKLKEQRAQTGQMSKRQQR